MQKVEGKEEYRCTISTEHKNQAAVFIYYRKAIIHFIALPLAVKEGSLLLNSLLVRMTTILKMGICDTLKKNNAVTGIISSYHEQVLTVDYNSNRTDHGSYKVVWLDMHALGTKCS